MIPSKAKRTNKRVPRLNFKTQLTLLTTWTKSFMTKWKLIPKSWSQTQYRFCIFWQSTRNWDKTNLEKLSLFITQNWLKNWASKALMFKFRILTQNNALWTVDTLSKLISNIRIGKMEKDNTHSQICISLRTLHTVMELTNNFKTSSTKIILLRQDMERITLFLKIDLF